MNFFLLENEMFDSNCVKHTVDSFQMTSQLRWKYTEKNAASCKTLIDRNSASITTVGHYLQIWAKLFTTVIKKHHETGTLFSFAHFFIVRMMYSTCGLPVFRRICKTSLSVSLETMKGIKRQK